MAAESEVKVIISVVDKYSKGLRTFTSSVAGVTRVAGLAATALTAMGVGAASLAVKLGSDLVRTTGDVQSKIYDVAAVAQEKLGQEAFPIVKDIVDDLTIRFPVMGVQAGQALETIAQLGYGAKEQLENLGEAAITLGTATTRDVGMAASTLVSTLNQFKLGEEDATKVANIFAAAQFNSAAALDDLQIALRYIGPTATNLGKSLEETVTAVALLRDRGIEASMAGAQLRMGLIKLAAPTKKGREALARMGVAVEDINPQTHTFAQLVEALQGKLTKVSDAADIFGVRSGPLMLSLVDAGATAFRNLQSRITGTDAAVAAAELKMKSFNNRVGYVVSSLQVLKTTMAGPLLEAVTDVLGRTGEEGLSAVVNELRDMEKETGAWSDVLTTAFNDIRDKVKEVFDEQFHGSLKEVYDFGTEVFQGLIDITKKVVEAIRYLVESGIELVRWWRDLDDTTKESYLNIAKWFALLGPGLLAVSVFASGIGTLIEGFRQLVHGTGFAIEKSTELYTKFGTIMIRGKSLASIIGKGALVPAVFALSYAIGRAISEMTGLDKKVQDTLEILFKNKEATEALAHAKENEARALDILREKYGIEAKTVAEGLQKKQELINVRERAAQAAEDEQKRLESIAQARIDMWYADTQAQIDAEQERVANMKKNNVVLLEEWTNGVKTYENTAEKARLYGDKMAQSWTTTASFIGNTPITPDIEDAKIRGKIDKLRTYLEKKLGEPITVDVYTDYHEDSKEAAG